MLKKTSSSNNNRGGALSLYRCYNFVNKDPIVDRLRGLIKDENISHSDLAVISGVSPTTLHNWFLGPTRRPQYATVMAVVSSLGYETQFVRTKKLDLSKEFEKAMNELKKKAKGRAK